MPSPISRQLIGLQHSQPLQLDPTPLRADWPEAQALAMEAARPVWRDPLSAGCPTAPGFQASPSS